jgi:hypothetical protein
VVATRCEEALMDEVIHARGGGYLSNIKMSWVVQQ